MRVHAQAAIAKQYLPYAKRLVETAEKAILNPTLSKRSGIPVGGRGGWAFQGRAVAEIKARQKESKSCL